MGSMGLRRLLRSCANVLWGALSAVARLGLHFVSADSSEQEAQQQLRAEFAQLPPVPGKAARGSWEANRRRLRAHVLSRDARGFLTWGVIRGTMFPPPYAAFARTELNFLKRHGWAAWRTIIRERPAGCPLPCLFYPPSSSNAIHHAYHLRRFEIETGVYIQNLGAILEFGGGYGSLCRIARNAGFPGTYTIFDLPEQAALQRYYLRLIGAGGVDVISEMTPLRAAAEKSPSPRLFIATWSLSESAVALRREVAEAIHGFDAFLIAYQSEFGGVDNASFFREWQSWFPHVRWTSFEITHLPASTYLFGVRL